MPISDHWTDNQKYADVFINNPMPMWIYDRETKRFLEVNEEAIRHYGYSRQEFLSMTIYDIRPSDDIPRLAHLDRIETEYSSIYHGVWTHFNKNGNLLHVEITSHLMNYQGREATLVLVNDITSQIEAEQLKEFEQKNKEALINSTDDMIWSVDHQLTLVAANLSFLKNIQLLLGIEMVPGTSVIKNLGEPLRQTWKEIYTRALAGEAYHEELFTGGDSFRQEEWLEVRLNPIYNEDTIEGVACYARNITERKNNEAALRESIERYSLISKATSDMVWDVNLISGQAYRNPEGWKKIFGEEAPADVSDLEEAWQKRLHPQDRERVTRLMEDLHRTRDQDVFEFECRVRRDDGTYAYTLDRGFVLRNEAGTPVRIVGATQDVTEKKLAETRLKESAIHQQRITAEAVINAQEAERQEIGRELHDNINQILATAKLYLGLIECAPGEQTEFQAKAEELIGNAVAEIRTLSHALITPTLEKVKLTESLNALLDLTTRAGRFMVHKNFSVPSENKISEKLKLTIYRIVQEQINNVQKYAGALNVLVELTQQPERLTLTIKDDGIGSDQSKKKAGVGLLNIRTRASLFNGSVKILSSHGKGFEITVTFPLQEETAVD